MRLIQLTKDKQTIVDADDYEELNRFKWHVSKGYAIRYKKINGVRKTFYMHREVNKTQAGLITDHINRDKLDNRKVNLRSVNHMINILNTGLSSNNTSGYKRLSWDKRSESWRIRISKSLPLKGEVTVYRKLLKDKDDAIDALLKAEKIHLPREFWQTKPELVC